MLKRLVDNLPDNKRKELLLALEQETSHYVMLDEMHYIGVNVTLKNLSPLETIGKWSYGVII